MWGIANVRTGKRAGGGGGADGGAPGADGRHNAWRSGALGPHAHGNTATLVVDDRRAEVHGQQKPSNDPRNKQDNRGTPTTGHR